MTPEDIRKILPYAGKRADTYAAPLTAAMEEFSIDSALRQAAFIAQVGHESGQLLYVREIASGSAYEFRQDLGNVRPGDGPRYKGRGLIQVTGRDNYRACGDALDLDLLAQPELLEQPVNACRSAAWFWKEHGLNELADDQRFTTITRRINGGENGLGERLGLYHKALEVLA